MKRRKTTTRRAGATEAAAGVGPANRRAAAKAPRRRVAASGGVAGSAHGTSLEQVIKRVAEQRYVLGLYVTGNTARSTEAVATVRALCDEHLPGRYELEVIDIYQQPAEAQG